MGSAHSNSKSNNSTPSEVGCCASPRRSLGQFLAQLRRKLSKKKRRCSFQRGSAARTALLRPMPRCSSYGSCSTLLTPSKQQQLQKKKKYQQQKNSWNSLDNNYAQWKCMFERSGKQPAAQRLHDISEVLSGQTTPRGFPSHTDARRCPLPEQQVDLERDLGLEQELLYEECKVKRRLSFRLPGSNQGSIRRLSARQKADQAKLEKQLQQELRDLEEYYGAFHYARRNERRI